MNSLHSARTKLLLALLLLAALLAAGTTVGVEAATLARLLLAACLITLGIWWTRRSTQHAERTAPTSRLQILERTGLSSRCALALVEADGRRLLLAYGEGFAQFCEVPLPAAAAPAVVPPPLRRAGATYRGVAV